MESTAHFECQGKSDRTRINLLILVNFTDSENNFLKQPKALSYYWFRQRTGATIVKSRRKQLIVLSTQCNLQRNIFLQTINFFCTSWTLLMLQFRFWDWFVLGIKRTNTILSGLDCEQRFEKHLQKGVVKLDMWPFWIWFLMCV